MGHNCVKSRGLPLQQRVDRVTIKGMNKSLFRYSLQEDHVGDCVLLRAVCDESGISAGQFECRPGQSSWESGLWVHRGPHSSAHWTPVEHYQVTLSNTVYIYTDTSHMYALIPHKDGCSFPDLSVWSLRLQKLWANLAVLQGCNMLIGCKYVVSWLDIQCALSSICPSECVLSMKAPPS